VPYVLDFDQIAQDQIAALPHDAAVALAEVWTFLQLAFPGRTGAPTTRLNMRSDRSLCVTFDHRV
jgi:hypothetical protein